MSLYFLEKETNELAPEARLVDIKEIMNTPYDKLVNMLIEGPKNEKYTKLIPENTKLNQTYKEKDMVYLDFSSEFLNFNKEDATVKQNIIDSLVKTLTQLTEVKDFNEVYSLSANE